MQYSQEDKEGSNPYGQSAKQENYIHLSKKTIKNVTMKSNIFTGLINESKAKAKAMFITWCT